MFLAIILASLVSLHFKVVPNFFKKLLETSAFRIFWAEVGIFLFFNLN